jgi:CubicO group peptidase (beta-lactamase class C family)
MERALRTGLIAGGVVLAGNGDGILFERGYGKVSAEPSARPVTVDIIFDLASLTKVITTTPCIMKLAEEGKLSLVDPISRWFPEFAGRGKDEILVVNLLTHTSGLDDFSLAPGAPLRSAIAGAAAQKLKGEVGSRFRYADINFILLGELVKRVSGMDLDVYAFFSIYRPLGMYDTFFKPGADFSPRCAATIGSEKLPLYGVVQDYTARQLGGVAGHAGLFSTARDLALFCTMILDNGQYQGRQVLSRRAVDQMTVPYFSRGGKVVRGLGWDIDSPYSSPRGEGFSEVSFGHTGYSGASVWIDPASDTYVIFLASRLEYRHTNEYSKLRSELSTAVAERLRGLALSGDRLTTTLSP